MIVAAMTSAVVTEFAGVAMLAAMLVAALVVVVVLCKAGLSYFVIIILFHSPLADKNGAAM